jgi:hypothetical protein
MSLHTPRPVREKTAERNETYYLTQEFPHNGKKAHEISGIARKHTIHVPAADIFGRGPHSRRDHIARGVHKQLS